MLSTFYRKQGNADMASVHVAENVGGDVSAGKPTRPSTSKSLLHLFKKSMKNIKVKGLKTRRSKIHPIPALCSQHEASSLIESDSMRVTSLFKSKSMGSSSHFKCNPLMVTPKKVVQCVQIHEAPMIFVIPTEAENSIDISGLYCVQPAVSTVKHYKPTSKLPKCVSSWRECKILPSVLNCASLRHPKKLTSVLRNPSMAPSKNLCLSESLEDLSTESTSFRITKRPPSRNGVNVAYDITFGGESILTQCPLPCAGRVQFVLPKPAFLPKPRKFLHPRTVSAPRKLSLLKEEEEQSQDTYKIEMHPESRQGATVGYEILFAEATADFPVHKLKKPEPKKLPEIPKLSLPKPSESLGFTYHSDEESVDFSDTESDMWSETDSETSTDDEESEMINPKKIIYGKFFTDSKPPLPPTALDKYRKN